MGKVFEIPLETVVKKRYSVRTYSDKPLPQEIKGRINKYISELTNPFSGEVAFRLLELSAAVDSKKLGTYGMIKGASVFIGSTVKESELAYEAVGYEFEKLILYAASLGLGTCWLGGTFNRGEFARAMEVKEGELFPAISPLGWPADKKRMAESLVRFSVKADQRRPWSELFFNKSFSAPLSEADAGPFSLALKMTRLAPSASNKQPWRIVKDGNVFHFYEAKTQGYSDRLGYDIQRIDMGIAACHFHLAAMEKDLDGEFKKLTPAVAGVPEHTQYVFSWVFH